MLYNRRIYTFALAVLLTTSFSSGSSFAMEENDFPFQQPSHQSSNSPNPNNENDEEIQQARDWAIGEDDTIFIPDTKVCDTFLEEEGLILNHRTMQSGGTKLKPKFGLSIDGGGIRGLMPALWLKKLDEKLEDNQEISYGRLSEIFDYVGGTSIGGILSLGVAQSLKADDIVNLLKENAERVFPSGKFTKQRFKSIFGLIGSKYDPSSLEELLKSTFEENTTLGEAKMKPKFLATACTTQGNPVIFKSSDKSMRLLKLWEVARCTSAAPTYFPAYPLLIDGKESSLVDGGMWINNPAALIATSIVQELHDNTFSPQSLYMLSLGTGNMSSQITLPNNAGLTGAGSIINILMHSHSEGIHRTMKQFLGDNNYFRMNPTINKNIDLAATDSQTLQELQDYAETELDENLLDDFIDKVVEHKKMDIEE